MCIRDRFYNKQVLKDLGYEKTPDTWEGILEVAKKAKEAGKEGYLLRAQAGENILTDIYPILLAFSYTHLLIHFFELSAQ